MNDVKRSADYTPTQGAYAPITPFRYFCQKVLPLVYDDSLSYYELLCKVVAHLNTVINNTNGMQTDVTNLYNAYTQLQEYVNHYFDTLDIQSEVDKKLDEMAAGGELTALFAPTVADIAQPKVVTNVSQMVNEKYTYVLESNGHMYQYRNGAWVDTGLVLGGAPDGFFSIRSEVPTDLNNITNPGIYFHSTGEGTVSNTPDDIRYNTSSFMVACFKQSDIHNVQLFIPERTGGAEEVGTGYYRHQITTGEWSGWSEINTTMNTLPNADLNQIKASGAFYHSGTPAATHTPNDAKYGSSTFMVVCYYTATSSIQVFYDTLHGVAFTRSKGGSGAWLTWDAVMGHRRFLPVNDLNGVDMSGYFLHAVVDEAAVNTPFGAYDTSTFILESHFFSDSIGYQIFYPTDISTAFMRRRNGTNTWSEWVCINTTGNGLPNSDLNEIKVSGAFFHEQGDTAAVNTPGGYENVPFMVMNYYKDNLSVYQMLHGYALNDLWVRVKNKASGSFTPWKEITGGSDAIDTIIVIKLNELMYQFDIGTAKLVFRHETDSNTNTDIWTIINIIKNDTSYTQGVSTMLGRIRPENEPYIGFGAGHDRIKFFNITFDGITWDYNSAPINTPVYAGKIQINMASSLYSATTGNYIFDKYTNIILTQGKMLVETLYKATATVKLTAALIGGTFGSTNNIITALSLNNYYQKDITFPLAPNSSKNNINATLFTTDGSFTLNNITGKELTGYTGYISSSSDTTYVYFNLANTSITFGVGDELSSAFELIP